MTPEMSDIKGELKAIRWILTFHTAMLIGLFWMVFQILARLPRTG